MTTQALNRQVGVLGHDAAPEMCVRATTTGGLQVALDDRNPKELVRPLYAQGAIHQQDTLPLVSIERGVTRDVDDWEVAPAFRAGVHPVAPIGQDGLVTVSSPCKGRLRLVG